MFYVREEDIWYNTFTILLNAGKGVNIAVEGADTAADAYTKRYPQQQVQKDVEVGPEQPSLF
jgi:hypothetical protein